VLLDTAFLIDLMDGDSGAAEKAREIETELVQQRLSAMTLFDAIIISPAPSRRPQNASRSNKYAPRSRSMPPTAR
jgi:hypothetical protein